MNKPSDELLYQRDGDVFLAIEEELKKARKQFPNPANNFTALIEEVGELATALLNEYFGKEAKPGHGVWHEAMQVATMAIRIASEGDPRVTKRRKP